MRALELAEPGFAARLAAAQAGDWPVLRAEQAALAYWAAASWGGWISLSKDNPDVVADLPLAVRLAQRAWRPTPTGARVSLTSLIGTFEAARPGGSPAQARPTSTRPSPNPPAAAPGHCSPRPKATPSRPATRNCFARLLQQALAIKDEAPVAR